MQKTINHDRRRDIPPPASKTPVGKSPARPAAVALIAVALASAMTTQAFSKGGTAKPPSGAVAPFIVPTLPTPNPTGGTWANIHGFDVTGFIEAVTADTVRVNGITYKVPANLVVQMPANTLSWANATAGATVGLEARIIGNDVGPDHIAGLIYLSQQSTNTGTAVITRIDYATGDIWVGVPGAATPQEMRIQINDPLGRFGRPQSPDPRFSVDDQNPTIHAGTGYPMCVPRTDPGTTDDPRCPQKNRPKAAVSGCRNFSVAGMPLPVSGELSPPAAGQVYCSQFVMKAIPGSPGTTGLVASQLVSAADDPDPREQAPFEVGDTIIYSGTMMSLGGVDYISAHTIEANVGIYTQGGTLPSYAAIGDFGVGTADPTAIAPNGVPQETQNRIFLEASVTDLLGRYDIYYLDVDPTTGAVSNRWVTPYEMTGECNPAQNLAPNCLGSSGGITTQFAGPQPQRVRIRATKAVTGILSAPSRNVRVMVRSMCPLVAAPAGSTRPYDQVALDTCVSGQTRLLNGLVAGQYYAPVFEYIFPENVKPGDIVVPNDLWHLPFLALGEGPAVPPLAPTPW